MKQRCMMLGAGPKKPKRRLPLPTSASEKETAWTTLDMLGDPDIHFDLNVLRCSQSIPVSNESYDEIHAYEVLEHFSQQGDFKAFFMEFREFWRILKPGGALIGTCPSRDSEWAWGDPGHTRIISRHCVGFLTKEHYVLNPPGTTMSSDYRSFVDPCWWEWIHCEDSDSLFKFGLRKV